MNITPQEAYAKLHELWSRGVTTLSLGAYGDMRPDRMAIADPETGADILTFSAFKPTPASIYEDLPDPVEYDDKYCVEYAIALLSLYERKGHIGPTIEIGFGDKDSKITVLHAIVHTLGEDDNTGHHSKGRLQNICDRWRDIERANPDRTSDNINYWIESFRDPEAIRERFFVLGLPINQLAVMGARRELSKDWNL